LFLCCQRQDRPLYNAVHAVWHLVSGVGPLASVWLFHRLALSNGDLTYVMGLPPARSLDPWHTLPLVPTAALLAGVAVNVVGHGHPALAAAIGEQAARLMHVSNYFYNEPNVRLAAELARRTGMDRVFFCNSGAEANEALLKLARHHFFARGEAERFRVIAFEEAFHGRTLGALALTGRAKYREGFGPFAGGVTHVPYGDLPAVRAAMGSDVAAIVVESVQGEGGVIPAPPGFLAGLRAICDEAGALLLIDEVQTGVGRTGAFLGLEHDGVSADAIALAKGLGGGFPIGAMACREALAGALPPGTHGSTYGGNPLASAASLAVLRILDEEGLVDGARTKGEHLSAGLARLADKYADLVEPERGRGLMRALPLRAHLDGRAVLGALRDRGLLVTIAGDRALRFTPPLVVSTAELDEALAIVDATLGAARAGAPQ
jgi:acetylornithine/N-succinyldiaminopimelate aminotransferase